MEMYMVGGAVRDELLGVPSKDIDFTVVMEFHDAVSVDPFKVMVANLENMGIKIIRDNDGIPIGAEFLTARGIAPKTFPTYPGRALDFVLARKESDYTDGRRPDKVEVGDLMDDLSRRDFTMNAIAKAPDGNLIDPFNGQQDIKDKVIRCVGDPMERFIEDALRAVRALRFSVTKGFVIDEEVSRAMQNIKVLFAIENQISDERIQIELSKMFRFDTVHSLWILSKFPKLTQAMFAGNVSLDATMKLKGRNK